MSGIHFISGLLWLEVLLEKLILCQIKNLSKVIYDFGRAEAEREGKHPPPPRSSSTCFQYHFGFLKEDNSSTAAMRAGQGGYFFIVKKDIYVEGKVAAAAGAEYLYSSRSILVRSSMARSTLKKSH